MQGLYNYVPRLRKPHHEGSRKCLGGCGRMVSSTRRSCMSCLTRYLTASLEAKGVEIDPADMPAVLQELAAEDPEQLLKLQAEATSAK